MAERLDVEKSVEDLEKEITCAICHEHYTEPKVLPCCHYYCKQCVHRLTQKAGIEKPFSCPECRKDITIPQGNLDELPTAFFVNRMKELHSKLERAHGKVDAKCEMCSRNKAEAFCRQCVEFICPRCVQSHELIKIFAGHIVTPLDKLKEGAKDIVIGEAPVKMCKEHDEAMKIFCFDCNTLICRDCTVIDHAGHKYEFVKKYAVEIKKNLIEHLEPLKDVKNLSHAVEEVKISKNDLEAQGASLANDINSLFDELQKIIESRRQELLKEAALKVTKKFKCLSGQEKSLSTSCAVVQSVIEYTEQCVEHSRNDDIMCMHVEIKSRIEKEIKEHCKVGKNFVPEEEVDIGVEVSCFQDLEQFKIRLIQLPVDPAKCAVRGEGVKNAKVSRECELFLTPKLTNGKHTKRECAVDCHLKSLVNGSIVKCNIDRREDNEYRISYTPTTRGRHELTVTVNGQETTGSPFPVFVSIHPSKLDKPVKVISGLKCPADLVVNSIGEIIVAEHHGGVVALDKDGKRLRSIKGSDHEFKKLFSVAVDEEDNIYFVDYENNNIYKSNKTMEEVRKQEMEQEVSGSLSVSLIKDEIMVLERDSRYIKVYDKELVYLRKSKESTGGIQMCFDEHGNLYVSTSGENPCIQVFSSDCKYLRSFTSDEKGVNRLKCPAGVCVAGQHLYVVDFKNHNVSVFTTKGEYVTSFGQEGSNEGDLKGPWGICVDKDGFVYVGDSNNGRIQIF